MAITNTEAREALMSVVQEWWTKQARPLLGSQLKVKLVEKLPGFSEKELGYRNFASFVRDCEGVAQRFRGETDFAVVPAQNESAFDESPEPTEARLRIRNDFWQAFVSFAIPNQVRVYIRATDKIFRGPQESIPPEALVIKAISKEDQLAWRRTFADSLGTESPLAGVLPQLKADGGFKAFTDALEPHPDLRRRWHAIFAKHVAGAIRSWATPHGIPDAVWLFTEVATPVPQDIARKRIYELLDTISVDQLLELRLPIRWFLNISSSGGTSEKK